MIESLLSELCDERMELLCVTSINSCFYHGGFRYRKNDSSDEILVKGKRVRLNMRCEGPCFLSEWM